MIKKLRIKFIAMSMVILFAAITMVSIFVYFLAMGRIQEQTDQVMDLIIENAGRMPSVMEHEEERNYWKRGFVRTGNEMPYETSYFVVHFDGEGNTLSVDTSFIMSVDEEEAEGFACIVWQSGKEQGKLRNGNNLYEFRCKSISEDNIIMVFMDISSRMWIVKEIFLYILMVGFIILLLFFVLLAFYSKREVKPYIENMERQKRFVTNASHELKTPLAVISANTEMMEALNGKSKWTESNMRQVERLNGLVAELVTLARLDEREELPLVNVDFSKAVKDASDNFEQVVLSQGKAFKSYVGENLIVRGEEKTLGELVTIFIDNAAKYCDDGGQVNVAATALKGQRVQLQVTNTYRDGAGIDYSRFFERFYRGDQSHNSKKSGYGIGLSIAREIVDKFKGKLTVSYQGDTIIFTVLFPMAKVK